MINVKFGDDAANIFEFFYCLIFVENIYFRRGICFRHQA
jgi:hypothetical protein